MISSYYKFINIMAVFWSFILSSTYLLLSSTSVALILVLVGIGLLDRMGLVLTLNYLSVSIFRFILLLLHQIYDNRGDQNAFQQDVMPIILNISEILVWITLSLFVSQMKTI